MRTATTATTIAAMAEIKAIVMPDTPSEAIGGAADVGAAEGEAAGVADGIAVSCLVVDGVVVGTAEGGSGTGDVVSPAGIDGKADPEYWFSPVDEGFTDGNEEGEGDAVGPGVPEGKGEGAKLVSCLAGGKTDEAPISKKAKTTARTGANSSFFFGELTVPSPTRFKSRHSPLFNTIFSHICPKI